MDQAQVAALAQMLQAQMQAATAPPLPPGPPPMQAALSAEALGRKQEWVVASLHQGHMCPDDAMRFPDEASLAAHMAAGHHGLSQRKQARQGSKRRARPWMLSSSEWAREPKPIVKAYREARAALEEEARAQQALDDARRQRVPLYDDPSGMCGLCGEPLDQFWDDDSSQWMYSGAVRVIVAEGRMLLVRAGEAPPKASRLAAVHGVCFQGADSREAARMLSERRASMHLERPPSVVEDAPPPGGEATA